VDVGRCRVCILHFTPIVYSAVPLAEAKRQSNNGAPAFNGAFGVDSQDILNAPQIDFGTFQLFPDQNNYGTTGVDGGPPSSAFDSTLNQTTAWISSQVDTVPRWGILLTYLLMCLISELRL